MVRCPILAHYLGMTTATISIPVDPEAARAFTEASPEEQRKLALLLSLRLRELTLEPVRPLREIMDEIGTNAEARGLTPEILDELLRDE
jgi:ferritin-like protein